MPGRNMTPEQQIDYWIKNKGACHREDSCRPEFCIFKKYMHENEMVGCRVGTLYYWALEQRKGAEGNCQSIW